MSQSSIGKPNKIVYLEPNYGIANYGICKVKDSKCLLIWNDY